MTAPRKLVLHIGSHKTGTTSIQYNLAHNSEALASCGYSYFWTSRVPDDEPAPDLHSWLGFANQANIAPRGMTVLEPERLTQELANTTDNVVISAENFSFFFNKQEIKQLHAALTPVFSTIEVVCYVRRQDRHVISHHQEGSKAQRKAEYQLFGHSGLAIPPWTPKHDLYLDYNRRLSMWAEVFGPEAITVRVFDRSRLLHADAVTDFFGVLGVPTFTRIPDRNVSVGLGQAKIGHLLNATRLAHHELISMMVRARVGDGGRALPSRQQAQDYYSRYRDSNEALAQWTGLTLFDDNFDEYGEQQSDLWDEATATEVMRTLLETMDVVASRSDMAVDGLRDLAASIGEESPRVATELLRMALDLRPGGPLIQQMLETFEQMADESV